jgi:hypothetical protein
MIIILIEHNILYIVKINARLRKIKEEGLYLF